MSVPAVVPPKSPNRRSTLSGIYPAVMTAYDDAGDVATAATLDLVDHLLASGVHGLFIGGTAGEGPLQSVQERRALAEAVVGHVAGRVPIISHIGALPFRDTVELARHAKSIGIADVAAIPPLYYGMDGEVVADYFRALARETGGPVMAYHVPHLSHRPVSAAWIASLGAEGVLSGVKFSADDLGEVQSVIDKTRGIDFRLLSGSDPLCLGSALAGSDGAVGVSINAMPGAFVGLWESVRNGNLAEAARLQLVISRFVSHMFDYNFIAYLRHVLSLQGVQIGANREPLPNLTEAQKSDITRYLHGDDDIAAVLNLV